MLEDRWNANHPAPTSGMLRREADREAREAEAAAHNAALVKLRVEEWEPLKAKLAAIVEKIGKPRGKGWALACLEDADTSIAMLLDEARE